VKYSISVLALVVSLFVAGVPTLTASTVLYDNGPYNGTTDAYTINNGWLVSNGFTTSGGTATGANFVVWAFSGDTLTSVDWAFGSTPGGTEYASGTASATLISDFGGNGIGYDLQSYGISFLDVPLLAGTTYWLSLSNAAVPNGDYIYWDENDGPATGWQNNDSGYLSGSEAFQITGGSSPIPEPASFGLMGLGLVGMAGLIRRRISA